MADLTDELLKRIIEGSGRVYTNEAKDMAREIVRWREKAKADAQQNSIGQAGWGLAGQAGGFHP